MTRMLFAARWPLTILVLALAPRLIDLGSRPFWLDEVFTLLRASLAPWALVLDSFQNHHMPSFFLLLSPLIPLGNPQFWLRFPSAIFGAVSVMLVFMIAERIAGRVAGVFAALLLGLSPAALAFSQEARSYTLEMCLILLALYGLTLLALEVPRACLRLRDHAAGWLAFIAGSVAALDVLGDGLTWLLAANLIALALFALPGRFTPASPYRPAGAPLAATSGLRPAAVMRIGSFMPAAAFASSAPLWHPAGYAPARPSPAGPRRWRLLLNFLLADLIIGLLCAPFYLLMAHYQIKGFVETLAWIPPLNLTSFWYSFGSVYFMHIPDSVTFGLMDVPALKALVWGIDAALLLAVAGALWVLRRRPAMLALLGISFMLLPALLTTISIWHPILLPRYMFWSAAPFDILAGIGAAALLNACGARLRGCAMAACAALLLANMLPYYQAETKPRWDIAAQMLAQEVAPGDVLYVHDLYTATLLQIYLPAGAKAVVLNDTSYDLGHVVQAMNHGKRVWAVYGLAGQSGAVGERAKFFAGASVLGTPRKMQIAGGRIFIALYTAPSHGKANSPG